MHSLILIIIAALIVALAWRFHRKWERETAARSRTLRRAVRRIESRQERVLRQAARETQARQCGAKEVMPVNK